MARWVARSVAVVGIGGTLLVGGGAAAYAAPASTPTDPVQGLTSTLQKQVTNLTKSLQDPSVLTKALDPNALTKSVKLPSLPVPSGPLVQVCGIAAGLSGPINGSCPHSGQKVVTGTTPEPVQATTVVTKVVKEQPVVVQEPAPAQPVAQAAPAHRLAYTGFETMPIAAAGLAALLGGVVLTTCARPRRS